MTQLDGMNWGLRARRILCLFICFTILLMSANSKLYANRLTLQFLPNSSVISEYRYQINGENQNHWTTNSVSDGIIILDDFKEDEDTLYIQQSRDGQEWGNSIQFQFNTGTNTWEVRTYHPALPPVHMPTQEINKTQFGFSFLDIRAQIIWPDSICNDFLSYGYGGKIEGIFAYSYAKNFLENLQYSISLEYRIFNADSSWITSYQNIGCSVGLGIPIPLNPYLSFIPELETGILMHRIDGDALQGDTGTFFDAHFRIASTLVVGKSDKYQFVVSPNMNWFFEEDGIGSQIGVDTGIRRSW